MSESEAVLIIELEPELRDSFMTAVAAAGRPASEVLRELMRDYIACHQRVQQHHAYLDRKVELARVQRDAGQYVTNEDVEAKVAARRGTLRARLT